MCASCSLLKEAEETKEKTYQAGHQPAAGVVWCGVVWCGVVYHTSAGRWGLRQGAGSCSLRLLTIKDEPALFPRQLTHGHSCLSHNVMLLLLVTSCSVVL